MAPFWKGATPNEVYESLAFTNSCSSRLCSCSWEMSRRFGLKSGKDERVVYKHQNEAVHQAVNQSVQLTLAQIWTRIWTVMNVGSQHWPLQPCWWRPALVKSVFDRMSPRTSSPLIASPRCTQWRANKTSTETAFGCSWHFCKFDAGMHRAESWLNKSARCPSVSAVWRIPVPEQLARLDWKPVQLPPEHKMKAFLKMT